jgi:hypothetical protein
MTAALLVLLAAATAAGERLVGEARADGAPVRLWVSPDEPRALAPIQLSIEGWAGAVHLTLRPLDAAGAGQRALLVPAASGRAEGRVRLPDPGRYGVEATPHGADGVGARFTLEVLPFRWLGFAEEAGFFVALTLVFGAALFGLARRLRRRSLAHASGGFSPWNA